MHPLQKYLDQKKIERPDFLREDVKLSEYEQGCSESLGSGYGAGQRGLGRKIEKS